MFSLHAFLRGIRTAGKQLAYIFTWYSRSWSPKCLRALVRARGCDRVLLGSPWGTFKNQILKTVKISGRSERALLSKNSIWSALVARGSFGGAPGCCWVLLGLAGSSWVLLGAAGCSWVLLGGLWGTLKNLILKAVRISGRYGRGLLSKKSIWSALVAWKPGGLEAWRPRGLEDWRPGGLEAWRPRSLERKPQTPNPKGSENRRKTYSFEAKP